MVRRYEYCPKCESIQSLRMSLGFIEKDPEGLQVNFHCETCGTFIRQVSLEDVRQEESAGVNDRQASQPG